MEEMPMKLIIVAILLTATLTLGFKALSYATQSSEEAYATQSLSALITSAKMVTNGAVGSKQLVPVKLAGNSKIVFSNEMMDGFPQGRLDIQLSSGNTLIEVVQLPMNYLQRDGSDIGNMTIVPDNKLNIAGSGSTRMEVFFPQGEYRFILVHRRADDTGWASGKGTDYLEVSLY